MTDCFYCLTYFFLLGGSIFVRTLDRTRRPPCSCAHGHVSQQDGETAHCYRCHRLPVQAAPLAGQTFEQVHQQVEMLHTWELEQSQKLYSLGKNGR